MWITCPKKNKKHQRRNKAITLKSKNRENFAFIIHFLDTFGHIVDNLHEKKEKKRIFWLENDQGCSSAVP